MNELIKNLPTCETERLYIRPLQLSDAEDMYDYAKLNNVGPRAGWMPHENLDSTKEIIESMIEDTLTENNIGVWSIIVKESNQMIGTVGLHRYNPMRSHAELGYVLHPDHWGYGYMREASIAIIDWAFNTFGLYRLECDHFDFNQQSKRVIEKLGFTYEGIQRKKVVLLDGTRCDLYKYSILKEEFTKGELPWQK